jgi:hypothetical protein
VSEQRKPKQTLDAEEHRKDLEDIRKHLTDAINLIDDWQTIERKKKDATPTKVQGQ